MADWVPFDLGGPLPPERRLVLVRARDERRDETVIAVGFLITVGSVTFFACPGLEGTGLQHHTHWCDCLGDDFSAPHWHEGLPPITQAKMLEET
jgi:hypothetical protein